jgi:hypothetical protein
LILRFLAACCCIFTAACAPIWFPTNNPFSYSWEEFARAPIQGNSDDVIEVLGQPHIKLQGGRLWIYGLTRAAKTDGLGSYQHDYRAVLIEFSEGVVVSRDLVHGEQLYQESCWNCGICLEPVWDSRSSARGEPKALSRRYSAVSSLGKDDARAKRFIPDNGQCAVYVYSGRSFFRDSMPPVLTIGNARDEPVPIGGYLYFQSPPRRLQLIAGKHTEDIDCKAGSLSFYKLDKYMATDEDNILINSVGPIDGRKAINKRQMLLTW